MEELIAIAEENDGLLTSKQARQAGILDSVLVRLAQRGRLERASRGVYRIAHYPHAKFSQYREAILWAEASQGPEGAVLSHETALAVYGISDANPSQVHITVPKSARLRRERRSWIAIHRDDLEAADVTRYEGLPMTTVARTITDVLHSSGRTDLVRQAISDARRDGLINDSDTARLRRRVNQFAHRPDDHGALREESTN